MRILIIALLAVALLSTSVLSALSSIRAGKNLSRFLTFTEKDPLFYISRLDYQELEGAIHKLNASEERFQKTFFGFMRQKGLVRRYPKSSHALYASRPFVYPSDYLRAFAKASEAHEDFIGEPTVKNAKKLLLLQKDAAEKYRKDVERAIKVLEEGKRVEESPAYRFLGSDTTSDIILSDFALIKRNADELKKEAKKRSNCLFRGECKDVSARNFGDSLLFSTASPRPPSSAPSGLIPGHLLAAGAKPDVPHAGPFLIETPCIISRRSDGYVPLYVFYTRGLFLPKQGDENYYLKSPPFKRTGYDDQPEGASYQCTDLRYWGVLSLMVYLDKDAPLASYDLYELMRFYQKALQEEDNLPADVERTYRERLLVWENSLTELPAILRSVASGLDILWLHTEFNFTQGVSTPFILAVQNPYSITYGTFLRSVWRIDEIPRYLANSYKAPPPFYKTYHNLAAFYSDEEITSFHAGDWEFLRGSAQYSDLLKIFTDTATATARPLEAVPFVENSPLSFFGNFFRMGLK